MLLGEPPVQALAASIRAEGIPPKLAVLPGGIEPPFPG